MQVIVNGNKYEYPDLVKAWKKGLKLVKSGKADLHMYYSNKRKRDESVFHVSDLGVAHGLCPRKVWLRLQGAEKGEKHYGEEGMLLFGEIIHIIGARFLELGLPDYWEISAVEKTINDGLPEGWAGRLDVELKGKQGEKVIVDFKTSRGKNFYYLDNDGAKKENKSQVRGYCYADKGDYGILFYVDREGQNGVRQFLVEPDSEQVLNNIKTVEEKVSKEPPILTPTINIKENKGDNSIKVSQPWNCDWCDYQDVSCPGALPPALRDNNRVVAKMDSEGEIRPYKDEYEDYIPIIKEVV
jgi:hypothetical protein